MKIRKETLVIKSVESYEPPRYPTLAVHTSDPAFTARHIPRSWATKNLTLGVLAAYTLSGTPALTGSSDVACAVPTAREGQATRSEASDKAIVEQVSVAPVFIHGDGRGAVGCVVIGAPVFLTEDEAIEIVLAELERGGLSFDERNHLVPGLEWHQPLVRKGHFLSDDRFPVPARKPFTVELYDSRTKLAVKLITGQNYTLSGGAFDGSTVSDYDLLALAQETVERLQAAGHVNAVVFYDPLEYGGSFAERREAGIARAREQLRAQVQDFLLWLKTRGRGTNPRE
jgi:hypothetical protein